MVDEIGPLIALHQTINGVISQPSGFLHRLISTTLLLLNSGIHPIHFLCFRNNGMLKEINFKIIDCYLGAQCSPRHACPLPGALLMQVHEGAQAAPVLVRRGVENSEFCMQSHAA
ncbi:TPA: hypothetical protein SLO90_001308 [Citrobacter koseri]|nr:hypothetical protein [Citrobacter koseri]